MAGPVYSSRLFRVAGFAGAAAVQFVAPAGYTTSVKCMGITIGSTLLEASAWIEADDGSKLLWAHASDSVTTSPFTLVEYGLWVLQPTETLSVATSLPTAADFWCSGYLLAKP